MPFRSLDGTSAPPPVRLEARDEDEKTFRGLEGFEFVVPQNAAVPDAARVVVVETDFVTDLASVPWPFWWLVASYGRHTRAAIVHDSLLGPAARIQVPRRVADYILLVALEDDTDRKHGSYVRHQLTWVAVCLFGTMWKQAKLLLAAFLLMVAAFWVGLVGAIGGWLPWWPAVAIAAAGSIWKLNPFAARKVAGRLWPVGAIALPAVLPAVALVLATSLLVWGIDLVAALVRGLRRGEWERPPCRPTRILA